MLGPQLRLLTNQSYPIQIAWIDETIKKISLTLTEINIIFNNNPDIKAYFL